MWHGVWRAETWDTRAAEDGAKLKTDRGRSVYALLMSAAPFSWPSPNQTQQPHTSLISTACFWLSPPWACPGSGGWFLKLIFLIRHQEAMQK